jgi:hypothetical protein
MQTPGGNTESSAIAPKGRRDPLSSETDCQQQ